MSGISLDEVKFTTGTGATDSDTLRVELSTESLAALENVGVTGTVAVSGSVAVTGPLTDTQLRATPVPVTGTFTTSIVYDTAILNSVETVTTTAAQIVTTSLANRKEITIQNEGTVDVYIGSSAAVTAANGIKISKNSSATYNFGPAIAIFMIAASGSQSVRILQAS